MSEWQPARAVFSAHRDDFGPVSIGQLVKLEKPLKDWTLLRVRPCQPSESTRAAVLEDTGCDTPTWWEIHPEDAKKLDPKWSGACRWLLCGHQVVTD